MTIKTERLLQGLCFGEGPRWHDGALWLSDMHAYEVLRVSADGHAERVVSVDMQPSGLGWLPSADGRAAAGDLLIVSMLDRKVLRYDGRSLTQHADLGALSHRAHRGRARWKRARGGV
jgi:sugar lactone lactonase YvrE